jgi:hypothetical protein
VTLCLLQSFLKVLGMASVCVLVPALCSTLNYSPYLFNERLLSSPWCASFHVFKFHKWLIAFPGIGFFFSAFMIGLTILQARYTAFSPKNSEEFNSASRSVKPGLIASGIVSAWTWAATLVCFLPQWISLI